MLHFGGSMKSSFIVMSLIIVALSIITSCASLETARQKNDIRGQILECTGNDAYLCVGTIKTSPRFTWK
jgi:hypothetical protein